MSRSPTPTPGTRSESLVHRLCEEFLAAGSRFELSRFTALLAQRVEAAPDPDMLLTNLLRFTQASFSRASLFNDVIEFPVIADVLTEILGQSQYLTDIIVRDPGHFRWLTTTDVLNREVTPAEIADDVRRLAGTFATSEKRLNALRRLVRRVILRIGAQDLLATMPFEALTRELSVLADAVIGETLQLALEHQESKLGLALPRTFAVIGLGKLGGRELNYSSDVDLMFVYDDEGSIPGPKRPTVTFHEIFNEVAGRVVQDLTAATGEGHLYRVDMRLRPEGSLGALARSIPAYLHYYETHGELWERQMLIKARVVAGDARTGERFLSLLAPFVYPRTLFLHPSEYVSRIKARIETAVGEEQNIKLMRGGIRDIEFIVQVLQLLHGGKDETLRLTGTLPTLDALASSGHLSAEDVSALASAYRFSRTVEHRLQMMLNAQTHTLPDDMQGKTLLAKRLRFQSAGAFESVRIAHAEAVRRIYDDVMAPSPVAAGLGENPLDVLFAGPVSPAKLGGALRALGFSDIPSALGHLNVLQSGTSLREGRGFETRTRDALRAVAPALFVALRETADPDMTLGNFAMMVAGHRFPHQLYAQLAAEGFRKLIVQFCGTSPWIARELARAPLQLESFCAAPEADRHAPDAAPALRKDPAGYKRSTELMAAMRNVTGFLSLEDLTQELTRLADEQIGNALRRAEGKTSAPLAIFGLGKLGSGELSFRGDLDIIFVAEGGDARKNARVASDVLRFLTAPPDEGPGYKVDVRLRPEGKSAPLVTAVDALAIYVQKRASLWERQSFTRLRFICGNPEIGRKVAAMTEEWVYRTALPPDWVQRIIDMRKKMEPKVLFLAPAPLNLKKSAGGMVDIEFITQMLQLHAGPHAAAHRDASVFVLLGKDWGKMLVDAEREFLLRSYREYREIEKLMWLTLEEHTSVLPEGEKLTRLARCHARNSGDQFHGALEEKMKKVRRTFQEISGRLA